MKIAAVAVVAFLSGPVFASECDPAFARYNTFRMTARDFQSALIKQGVKLPLPKGCFRKASAYDCEVKSSVDGIRPEYLSLTFKCGGRFAGVWTEWPLDKRDELLAFAKSVVRIVGGGPEDVAAIDRLKDGFTTPAPRGEKYGSPGVPLKGLACCELETSQRSEKTMQLYLHSRTLFK